MRSATSLGDAAYIYDNLFNPRAPCGARQRSINQCHMFPFFNPRAPCGARRLQGIYRPDNFFSIHALHAERDMCRCKWVFFFGFSIHALHAERDHNISILGILVAVFSIHALHAERDTRQLFILLPMLFFNPRAPCGARLIQRGNEKLDEYLFNPRAPCGARLKLMLN